MVILQVLGYERPPNLLQSRHSIPLEICGDSKLSAQADVALLQFSLTTLLVVQEGKITPGARDPEPQVVAEAIATFQNNNRIRREMGQPQLESMTVPAITITGARPIFYLVPITQELGEAVVTGTYPPSPTVECVVATESGGGMETLDFRLGQLALRHFTAFRTLAETHWSAFMFAEMEA